MRIINIQNHCILQTLLSRTTYNGNETMIKGPTKAQQYDSGTRTDDLLTTTVIQNVFTAVILHT